MPGPHDKNTSRSLSSSIADPIGMMIPSEFSGTCENDMPNLTSFAREVVDQQQQQQHQIANQQKRLNEKRCELASLNKDVSSLQEQHQTVSRQSTTLSDEVSLNRAKISDLSAGILYLMQKETALKHYALTKKEDHVSLFSKFNVYRNKMCDHAQHVRQIESANGILKRVENVKSQLSQHQNSVTKTLGGLSEQGEQELTDAVAQLTDEKARLQLMLQQKQDMLKAEEMDLCEAKMKVQMSQKRAKAQNLRLRGRITQAKSLAQQLEEEVCVLKVELGQLKNKNWFGDERMKPFFTCCVRSFPKRMFYSNA